MADIIAAFGEYIAEHAVARFGRQRLGQGQAQLVDEHPAARTSGSSRPPPASPGAERPAARRRSDSWRSASRTWTWSRRVQSSSAAPSARRCRPAAGSAPPTRSRSSRPRRSMTTLATPGREQRHRLDVRGAVGNRLAERRPIEPADRQRLEVREQADPQVVQRPLRRDAGQVAQPGRASPRRPPSPPGTRSPARSDHRSARPADGRLRCSAGSTAAPAPGWRS